MCIITPFIINQIGCQLTMLLGLSLSLVGALLPALFPATSLWIWWLGFGVANGTGGAILYISSSVVLEQYFLLHFGLASGIQSLGSSITFVLLPFLWQYLLDSGPAVSSSPTDSPAAIAAGLSLTMYSSVIMAALILPMLPLFSSPVFLAARRQSQRRLGARHHLSDSENINTEEGGAEGPSPSLERVAAPVSSPSCVSAPLRALYYVCDIPPRAMHYNNAPNPNQELGTSSTRSQSAESSSSRNSNSSSNSSNFRQQLLLYSSLFSERNFFLFALSGFFFMFATAVPDVYSVPIIIS